MGACHVYKAIVASISPGDEDAAITQASRSPFDALAVEIHAALLQSPEVTFVGLADGHDVSSAGSELGESWSAGSPNYFGFRYRIEGDSTSNVEVTVTKMGPSSVRVSAFSDGGIDISHRLELKDYVNESVFTRPEGSEGLEDLYASEAKTEKLVEYLYNSIVQKVNGRDAEPSKAAEGSGVQEERRASERRTSERRTSERRTSERRASLREQSHDSHAEREETPESQLRENVASRTETPISGLGTPEPPPSVPVTERPDDAPPLTETPPGFEDEYEIKRSLRRTSHHDIPVPGHPSQYVSIGEDDLYPPGIGRNPPMAPFLGPGSGRGPMPPGPQGMYPTLDHPLFQGPRGGRNGDQPDDLTRPPGARWDPTGPPGGLGGFGPNRFI